MNASALATSRQRIRLVVEQDLSALLRALQPAAVLGLVPTSMKVERRPDGLVVLLEFEAGRDAALRLYCARLLGTPAVVEVAHWAAN